ncbi:unnamed protein product [Didymodactylos carnosus]|uniref:ABC transmembrane type-1 domain-containing protein n=1 Tax=Didymodactylos carnosus TaxID=1234261 RepID=A0A815ZMZ2_9BILA|nr:unnamed protein product [Didymodactylos carnosus]CAF4454104.1 unnamed protein product [Didymodactylos carnosus]
MNEHCETSNPHPYEKSSWFSKIHHSWLFNIFKIRHKRSLESSDLYDLLSDFETSTLTNLFENAWNDEIQLSRAKNRLPSLFFTTIRTFQKSYLLIALLLISFECIRIGQPLILAYVLNYFKQCTTISHSQAWLTALLLCLLSWFSVTLRHAFYYHSLLLSQKIRICHMGLIFRKILRLHTSSFSSVSSGKMINLITNDVSKIEEFSTNIYYLLCGPIQAVFSLWLLWRRIGNTMFVIMIFFIVYIIIQMIFAKLIQQIW